MTTRTPLVVVNGQTQQMPTGDAVPLTHGGTGATTAGDALTALGGVPTARTLTVATPLTGGGDLSDNRPLGLSYDSTLQVSGVSLGVSALVALASHTHASLYAPLSHTTNTSNPHSTTAAQVGALALTGGTVGGGVTLSATGTVLTLAGSAGDRYVALNFTPNVTTETVGFRFGGAENSVQCLYGSNMCVRAFWGIDLIVDSAGLGYGSDVRVISGSTVIFRITKNGQIFAPGLPTSSPGAGGLYVDANGFIKRGT